MLFQCSLYPQIRILFRLAHIIHASLSKPCRTLKLLNSFCAANGMDRSCAATIYPVLDKPRTTGVFQDRRKIEALLRPS
jgi:hypothetical protein